MRGRRKKRADGRTRRDDDANGKNRFRLQGGHPVTRQRASLSLHMAPAERGHRTIRPIILHPLCCPNAVFAPLSSSSCELRRTRLFTSSRMSVFACSDRGGASCDSPDRIHDPRSASRCYALVMSRRTLGKRVASFPIQDGNAL